MEGYRVTFTFNFLCLLSYEVVQSLQETHNTARLQAIRNDKCTTPKIALRSCLGDSHFQSTGDQAIGFAIRDSIPGTDK